MQALPDIERIREAAATLRAHVQRTPLTCSRTLSEICGCEVWLKWESQQFTASFKERGARVKLEALSDDERRRGVIAMSRGNHAQAVAYHAQQLGIPATIVMPRGTPAVKVEQTRGFGARVELAGADLDEASARAHELQAEAKSCFVHPYEDPDVIAGQGTIALEVLEQQPELDAIVVPVGGGGLIAGIALASAALRPDLEVIGVETARYPSVRQALAGDAIVAGSDSFADGIAVKRPGDLNLEAIRAHVPELLTVDEPALERAVLLLLEIEKQVVEGAGAAPLAALLTEPARFAGRRCALIVSGGNIDLSVLATIITRGLARSARLVRLNVRLRDTPGALAELTSCLARAGANVVDLSHQRTFTLGPLRSAEVDLVIEARGREHVEAILSALAAAGLEARERPLAT